MNAGTIDAVAKALAARVDRRAALAAVVAGLPAGLAARSSAAKRADAKSKNGDRQEPGDPAAVAPSGRCVAIGDPCRKKQDKCCEHGQCKGKVCKAKNGGGGTVSSATFDELYSGTVTPYRPKGVALAPSGKSYVAENLNNRLLVFKNDVYSTRFSATTTRPFNAPYGVAVDGSSSIYVANSGGNNVLQLSTDGTVTATWSVVSGSDRLSVPHDVAVDGNGDVYVADTGNNRIVKFNADGTKLAVFGPATPDL